MSWPTAAVEACCAGLYGHPLVELICGQSLHPGGLTTTRHLLAEAPLLPGGRLLDAGCGLGASARVAALEFRLSVDACDISSVALKRAITLSRDAGATIRFSEASFLHLPYEDGTFAGVLAECVLSTTSKHRALKELRRVTTPAGWLLLSDVTATEAIVAPEPLASVLCLTQAWRPGELEEILAASGYVVARAWDETASVLSLLDRLEARIGLLTTMTRDNRLADQLTDFGREFARLGDQAGMGSVFEEARRHVRDGRLGYRAVVARAVNQDAGRGDHVAMQAA